MIQNRTTPAKPNLTRIPKVIHLMNRILLWVGPKKSVFIIYDFFCKNLSSNERKLVLTGKVFHPFQLLKTAIVVFSANASGISKAKIILWFKTSQSFVHLKYYTHKLFRMLIPTSLTNVTNKRKIVKSSKYHRWQKDTLRSQVLPIVDQFFRSFEPRNMWAVYSLTICPG